VQNSQSYSKDDFKISSIFKFNEFKQAFFKSSSTYPLIPFLTISIGPVTGNAATGFHSF